jgi:hypothetical protein
MKNQLDFKLSYGTIGIYLKPGEKAPETILTALRDANAKYSRTKKFPEYMRSIQQIFQLKPIPQKSTDCQLYLGGFLEGEGSLNVGAKKNSTSKFGVYLDPEFSLTQHLNGISNLYLAMYVFQTGRIRFKSGSHATFVYTIDNRQTLEEKVIPFYEKYVSPYGSSVKQRRTQVFKHLLKLFQEKAHLDLNKMLDEVLPLWDLLRMQSGQSNESFRNLLDAQTYVKNAASKVV